jgi:phenylalanyl-tRNA synthetase beta subunit
MAGEMARAFGLLPEQVDVAKATKWAWDRFQRSADATALDPKAQAVGKIRTWLAERWGSSVRNVEDDNPNREVLAWFDKEHVYIPDHRIVEAAGRALKEQEIIKALDEAGFIAKRKSKDVRHVDYIPKIGRGVKAYALPRSEFGRPYDASSDYPFRTYMGGRA